MFFDFLEEIKNNIILLYMYIFYNCNIPDTPTKADSFITNDEITIISVSDSEVDLINLQNYLNHNILHTDDVFYNVEKFPKPIMIKFKYCGEVYRLCLKSLKSKKHEHNEVVKQPRYLSVVVKNGETEIENITERMTEFHGNTRNFFDHIPDSVFDFSLVFDDMRIEDGYSIHTYDMSGNEEIIKL